MKMAMEGRFGKPRRRNGPPFLNRVIPTAVWQAFWEQVGHERRTDACWSAKYLLLGWVMTGWSLQDRLSERVRASREVLAQLFPRRRPAPRRQGVAPSAASTGGRSIRPAVEQVPERPARGVARSLSTAPPQTGSSVATQEGGVDTETTALAQAQGRRKGHNRPDLVPSVGQLTLTALHATQERPSSWRCSPGAYDTISTGARCSRNSRSSFPPRIARRSEPRPWDRG